MLTQHKSYIFNHHATQRKLFPSLSAAPEPASPKKLQMKATESLQCEVTGNQQLGGSGTFQTVNQIRNFDF